MRIFEVQSRAEFKRAFPVMRELRTHLDEDAYSSFLVENLS